MDFKDLVYLEAIDRHRNLTYAAQELFITQPALTESRSKAFVTGRNFALYSPSAVWFLHKAC